jgi:hypothetical protein
MDKPYLATTLALRGGQGLKAWIVHRIPDFLVLQHAALMASDTSAELDTAPPNA